MSLPLRAFYTVQDAAIRWGCTLDDIAGWAVTGKFDIVTAIEPRQQDANVVAGLGVVPTVEILAMFRRDGSGPVRCTIKRIRPIGDEDWLWIADPVDHIEVELADLLIMAEDVHRFEAEHDLLRRSVPAAGAPARYDWEGLYATLIQRVHVEGVPATQGEWIAEALDWFAETSSNSEVPDERTMRRRLGPIWKSLQEMA